MEVDESCCVVDVRRTLTALHGTHRALYTSIRVTEAQLVLHFCGVPNTVRNWTLPQRGDIKRALDRGGRCEALVRFGYVRASVHPKKGSLFRHVLCPETYAPLVVRWDTDVFEEWPSEVLHQVYLYDVLFARHRVESQRAHGRLLKRARE